MRAKRTLYGLACSVRFVSLVCVSGIAPCAVASEAMQQRTAMVWLTTGDQSRLLHREPDLESDLTTGRAETHISIDRARRYQEMVGFGASLTDASAWLINRQLSNEQRTALVRELFDPKLGIGLSFLRLTIGASDFSLHHYTFADLPPGASDGSLKYFSIAANREYVLPVVKLTREANPNMLFMGSPWSAPAWMKTNNHLHQGSLRPSMYGAYSDYLVRYVEDYHKEGISMFALTIQNEPHFEPVDYPGMRFSSKDRATFIGKYLGPKLAQLPRKVRIIEWDHNWDEPQAPLAVLSDSVANKYIAGVGWHCYAGNVEAQSSVHDAFPDKETYFTECSGGEWAPQFGPAFSWVMRNLIIGAPRHWAKAVLLWNLALDENQGPHLGGCKDCRGVVTVDSKTGAITRNLEYYALAHASRFVHRGARRLHAELHGAEFVDAVAFQNPNGSQVLIAANSASDSQEISIESGAHSFRYLLPANSAVTIVWPENSTARN